MLEMEPEKKIQIFDFIIYTCLIFAGCFVGSWVMHSISNTVLGFNGPAIVILLGGELIWSRVRKSVVEGKDTVEKKQDEE